MDAKLSSFSYHMMSNNFTATEMKSMKLLEKELERPQR